MPGAHIVVARKQATLARHDASHVVDVAVKKMHFMKDDEREMANFLREMHILSHLQARLFCRGV